LRRRAASRRAARTLLAAPGRPSESWLYLDADGLMLAECGRCEAWWFVNEHLPLEGELVCRECVGRALGVQW
jgi:hypothetical protein